MVFTFILLVLGVFKATEWTQEIFNTNQKAWFVSGISLGLSAGGVLLLFPQFPWRQDVLWTAGTAGGASVFHGVESLLVYYKFLANSRWLKESGSRRNSLGQRW